MARIRVPDEMRDRIRNYIKESGEYSSISEFSKDAIRRLLDKKEKDFSEEEIKEQIIKDIKEGDLEV